MIDMLKKRSFIDTWKDALILYLDNFFFFFLVTLISAIPLVLVPAPAQLAPLGPEEMLPIKEVIKITVNIIFIIALNTFSSGLIYLRIKQRYAGQSLSINEFILLLEKHIFSLSGLALLTSIIITMGIFLLVLPGVYFYILLSLVVAVNIIENQGIINSITRSLFLTMGKRLEIFLYSLLFGLLTYGIVFVFNKIIISFLTPQEFIPIEPWVTIFCQALISPLGACLFILIYFNIRVQKEGADLHFSLDE